MVPSLSAAALRSRSSVIRDLLRLAEAPEVLSLAGGLPAPELLPLERVAEAAARVLGRAGQRALQYGPTEGVDELRALVAAPLAAPPEQVLITTGSQQGIELVLGALAGPGDVVVVERPSYLGALQAATAAGAVLVSVPGDADGLDVDVLSDRLAAGLRPRALYLVSEFANPSGATLSAPRRLALVALARRYGFAILEDNPYGALRYRGAAVPSLRADAPELVVSLRTVSKTVAPGLRVGWLAAPPWLFPALVRAKQIADLHTAGLNQLIVADVLADDAFLADHLARLRAHYAQRQAALLDALTARFGARLQVAVPDGGMFLWVTLADPALADGDTLLAAALAHGTAFVPGSAFVVDGAILPDSASVADRRRLRLCYSTLDEAGLHEAVRRLAAAATAPRQVGVGVGVGVGALVP